MSVCKQVTKYVISDHPHHPSHTNLTFLPSFLQQTDDDDGDDDDIDCRVFRFTWTDAMFAAAIQQLKVIKYHT